MGGPLTAYDHLNRQGAYHTYSEQQFANSASITFWLDSASVPGGRLSDEEKHFGFTARYMNGDNPLTGELDQNVWTFGISVKY